MMRLRRRSGRAQPSENGSGVGHANFFQVRPLIRITEFGSSTFFWVRHGGVAITCLPKFSQNSRLPRQHPGKPTSSDSLNPLQFSNPCNARFTRESSTIHNLKPTPILSPSLNSSSSTKPLPLAVMATTNADARPPSADNRVPVTLVTGFLGSGKTTLVNHILREKQSRRIAVVENEFGEINIDGSLVAANLVEEEDLVSLRKGCVCCSLRKDIVTALGKLHLRSTEAKTVFDSILLETTGLADPAPVAFTFFSNPWIAARFRLDSILCVVDTHFTCKNLHTLMRSKKSSDHEDPVDESAQQLAFADVVMLNKIDLVTEDDLAGVKKFIHKLNPYAKIMECQLNKPEVNGKEGLPVQKILDLKAFSLEKALEIDPDFMDSDSGEDKHSSSSSDADQDVSQGSQEKKSPSGEDDEAGGASVSYLKRKKAKDPQKNPKRRRLLLHDTMDIYSVAIAARGALHPWRFNMFMKDFFTERHEDIFRCKGVLCIKGQEDKKFVFQGVHANIDYGPVKEGWLPNEDKINKVVFIGKNFDRKALTEAFRSCVWTPLPNGWTEIFNNAADCPIYRHEDGAEQAEMPVIASAHVETTFVTTRQPSALQPKRRRHVAAS